jgi:hypothetical protein
VAEVDGIDWPPAERARLIEHRQKATESFDKTVLTLSGGALGLSITFIHEIAPHPRHSWLVGLAWSCFCASLLLMLTSFLSSIDAHDSILRQMAERIATLVPPRRVTTWLNRIAAGFLIVGAVFLVIFAWFNVTHV